jgi:RNA polymerase sigma factor (sigma-70 family)
MDSRSAFEEMYRVNCGAVRAFVHRRVPADGADDVVAEVFVAAWRRLDEDPEDRLLWLFGIARGLIANRRRGEARRAALHERLTATAVAGDEPGPEDLARAGDSVLRDAFASLGERDQELLRLTAWEGLGRTQAAQVLGITPAVFSVRLHRARRRLARALQSDKRAGSRSGEQSSTEVLR